MSGAMGQTGGVITLGSLLGKMFPVSEDTLSFTLFSFPLPWLDLTLPASSLPLQ